MALEASLRAQLARQHLEAVRLEMERRYGLLGREATVDAHTGQVALTEGREMTRERAHEPE